MISILPKYFTLYIIYKKLLATPRKKQNDPLGGRDPQVEKHCYGKIELLSVCCRQTIKINISHREAKSFIL